MESAPIEALTAFRSAVAEFIATSERSGVACPAFGAILPPHLVERALVWQRACCEAGFAGIHWPTEHGGAGLSPDHGAVWFEECARAEVAPYLNLQGLILAGEAILRSGTMEQKQRYLRPTLSGEILWCQLFSEPGAGSDLASLTTSATVIGDHGQPENFVVNGQKVWSSNAQFAQAGILMARTDPELPKHRGISFFLVDMRSPGIEVRTIRQMTGDEEFCEVFFDEVVLPAESLLGPLNDGWRVALNVLQDERGSFGSAGAISLRRRLDHLTRLSRSAEGVGPVARDVLAQLQVKGRVLETLLRGSTDQTAGPPAAKLLRTEFESAAAQLEFALGGGSEALLYSPGMRIAGGSSEVQRNIIGERVLGLPKEPSVEG